MKLFEYQAKELFANIGIPVPIGMLIDGPSEISRVMGKIPFPWALKSQTRTGGRGKAGLIRFAQDEEQARSEAVSLFGSKYNASKILVEEKLEIKKELYLSITVDAWTASPLIMACSEGGTEIEELTRRDPGRIIMERVDMSRGLSGSQAGKVMKRLGLDEDLARSGAEILSKLYRLFREYDAELVEINPLVITSGNELVAADAKLNIDDNSLFRQKDFPRSREHFDHDLEFEAHQRGVIYIHLDGDIGIMSAGAGLTMTVLDLVNHYGGKAATFLEFGGAAYERAREAMKITLANPSVKVILITTFGLIARADVIAEGIVKAMEEFRPEIPLVAVVRGTGEERAGAILKEAGLTPLSDIEEAVRAAVRLAKEGVA